MKQKEVRRLNENSKNLRPGFDIAVIGMSCRLPKARNIEEFWNIIKNGTEAIKFFSDDELIQAGIEAELVKNPNYIKAKGYLEDVDLFDSAFFNYSPMEAKVMDPQIRIFHECVWEALEDSGYRPDSNNLIGLYAGASPNVPWEMMTFLSESESSLDNFTIGMKNNKDLLSTLISYNMNLKGPSITLYTACSTSLVAIHEACQGLLSGDCDIAIAGGVCVELPEKAGYMYQEGMIKSADGHCRPFDGRAGGTVYGDGAGVVILKRIEDALADRDNIYAVIKGTAINNDGRRKVGYTAPSVEGQAEVIRAAYQIAEIDPEDVAYIETHGTGTAIGDPIEIEGLKMAFDTDKKSFCAIGSVKSNIGHLDAAAGVVSFIKTVLVLKNKMIPPQINYTNPNLAIDFVNSPFFVNTDLEEWVGEAGTRIAGVSSFGLGGTNCHIVLQDIPDIKSFSKSRDYKMLMLSAKSQVALDKMSENLGDYLRQNRNVGLADVAYTLQVGRKDFKFRKSVVCRNIDEAIEYLGDKEHDMVRIGIADAEGINPIIVFSGTESYYQNIAMGLYEKEEIFRKHMDDCFLALKNVTGLDFRNIAFSYEYTGKRTTNAHETEFLSLIIQYSLFKTVIELGVKPHALVGYGCGEYVAACAADVISLNDMLKIVFRKNMDKESIPVKLLEGIGINSPTIPLMSGCMGRWIDIGIVMDYKYWMKVKKSTFNDKVIEVLIKEKKHAVFLAIMSDKYLKVSLEKSSGIKIINLLRQENESIHEQCQLLICLSHMWTLGLDIDWERYYLEEERARLPLPTYPFERKRYRVDDSALNRLIKCEANTLPQVETKKQLIKQENTDWFYEPIWEPIDLPEQKTKINKQNWLIFADRQGIAKILAKTLEEEGHSVVLVEDGTQFLQSDNQRFIIDPKEKSHYEELFDKVTSSIGVPQNILHMWMVGNEKYNNDFLELGFYSMIYLSQAIYKQRFFQKISLSVIADKMQNITGDEPIIPEKMAALAVCKVLPQEYPNFICRSIDIVVPNEQEQIEMLVRSIIDECISNLGGQVIGYRGSQRFKKNYKNIRDSQLLEALKLESGKPVQCLRENGVYLITGGLGGIGLALSRYLAKAVHAKLILVSRTRLPDRSEWVDWLKLNDNSNTITEKIKNILELEELGAEVLVLSADVADENQMEAVVKLAEEQFNEINGVIHAAGIVRVKSGQTPIEKISKNDCEEQFHPKIQGVYVLYKLFEKRSIDFCLLISSLAPILGGLGHVAYAAANLFMDAFIENIIKNPNRNWLCVNWAEWKYSGKSYQEYKVGSELDNIALTPEEGINAFRCVLSLKEKKRLVISTVNLQNRIEQWVEIETENNKEEYAKENKQEYSALSEKYNVYKSPRIRMEKMITDIWLQFYDVESVGKNENFFELGATSLDFIHLNSKISKMLKRNVPIETMFEYPTIESLASHLCGEEEVEESDNNASSEKFQVNGESCEIAVIGMSGKFPKARNIHEFWDNLVGGVECISFFEDKELDEEGISPEVYQNPNYIKAKGYLENADYFDAGFFNYSARDAELMDPQMRIFHECVWEALEDAGYNPETYEGLIGLFGGATPNLYWEVLAQMSQKYDAAGQFDSALLYDKDSLTTQISYKLNLKGPSNTIFTGCSTSLVAIDAACKALLANQCDIALAGGVTITLPAKSGYTYQDGMILSSDGHIRSFDAKASGMVFGDGAGVVVLKKLQDALNDGDNIYAVVKGSAVNNDGNRKVGYTSPSVKGQVEVIKAAQRNAGVNPESIGYIEAHGTATRLGDPIEFQALVKAFNTDKKGFCRIGTLKPNTGHMMCASGVAGFIKTVLILKNKVIPPNINFETPNSDIDFENSPFTMNVELTEWKRGDYPLRAGVSSFGIGGTNAHIILEEAPETKSSTRKRHWKMLTLSARTQDELDSMTDNLEAYLKQNLNANLSDIAYTLQVGRKMHKYRRTLVTEEVSDTIEILSSKDSKRIKTVFVQEDKRGVVFMFSGQGSQYVNMGEELYRMEPVFREAVDKCEKILYPLVGYSIKSILYPGDSVTDEQKEKINSIEITQLVLFVFEYALSMLLMNWGIIPSAMIGYSFGEYVAAHIAGILSLEDALKLISLRGELLLTLPNGAMLSVPVTEEELIPIIDEFTNEENGKFRISIAIINGPSCIVAGTMEAITCFERYLKGKKYISMRVPINYAVHSSEMEPIVGKIKGFVQQIRFGKLKIPYISGLTGTWITEEEATDPEYWARHLKECIRFSDGINELMKETNTIFVEVGPGRDLSVLISRFIENQPERIVNVVRPPYSDSSDLYYLTMKLAHLWAYGIKIDWAGFYMDEKRKKVSLPQYPFKRKRYWIDGDPYKMVMSKNNKSSILKRNSISNWFYYPQWVQSDFVNTEIHDNEKHTWLILQDKCGVASALVRYLVENGHNVVLVDTGDEFEIKDAGRFVLQPSEDSHFKMLIDKLKEFCKIPDRIVHCFGITGEQLEEDSESFRNMQKIIYYSVMNLVRVLGKTDIDKNIQLDIITDGMQEVTGEEIINAAKSTVLGEVIVIPQEYPFIRTRSIDIIVQKNRTSMENQLIREILSEPTDSVIALRGGHRWTINYVQLELNSVNKNNLPLREEGVYLITGGLGGIGYILARHLAKKYNAKLILTGRTVLPSRDEWMEWLSSHDEYDPVSVKIEKVLSLENIGAKVLVFSADVADEESMRSLIAAGEREFGPINGVIHSAGILNGKSLNIIRDIKKEDCEIQFDAKVYGLMVLDRILEDRKLDFCVFMSSISSVLGGLGFVAYAAANIFMDSFVKKRNSLGRQRWISVNWSEWKYDKKVGTNFGKTISQFAMNPQEAVEAFELILASGISGQLANSPSDLIERIKEWVNQEKNGTNNSIDEISNDNYHDRPPELMSDYVAPRNNEEETLAEIWQTIFKLRSVGVQDDFFELGGDSLKAITVVSRIHKILDVEIPVTEFFQNPTIEKLALFIKNSTKSTYQTIKPVEKKQYYSVSPAQKRVYIIRQLEGDNTSYNTPVAIFIEGRLDVRKLEESFRKIIARHETLRTSFRFIDGELVQYVHDKVEFNIQFTDISQEDSKKEIGALKERVKNFIKPFDLERAPLIRSELVKISDEKHLLMYDLHHIISDGVSANIVVDELINIYSGKNLPELKLQYRDFSEWQNNLFKTEAFRKQEKYWMDKLSGELPVLNMPTDFPRPLTRTFDGDNVMFEADKELTAKLNKLVSKTKSTLYTVLLAGYNILLSKYTGQDDIIVGLSTAGRPGTDLEKIIGMFVNTIVMRNHIDINKTFIQFVEDVKVTAFEAYENQDYQFDDLVTKLGIKRDLSRTPLFDTMFTLQNLEISEVNVEGLKVIPFEFETSIAKFDLNLNAWEVDGKIQFVMEYATMLFRRETIEAMASRFINILNEVANNWDMPIYKLESESKEKMDIMSDFNDDLENE